MTVTQVETSPDRAAVGPEGCDRCGHSGNGTGGYLARASVRYTLPSGLTLMMCAHHGRDVAPHMSLLGATVEHLPT